MNEMIGIISITLPTAHIGQKVIIQNDNKYPIEVCAHAKEEIVIKKDEFGREYFTSKTKSKIRLFLQFFGLSKDKPVLIMPRAIHDSLPSENNDLQDGSESNNRTPNAGE